MRSYTHQTVTHDRELRRGEKLEELVSACMHSPVRRILIVIVDARLAHI